jgi:hypothetical protein
MTVLNSSRQPITTIKTSTNNNNRMDSLLNASSDELKRDGIIDNSIIQNSQKKNEHEQELILMDEIKITSRPDKKQILVE